LFYLRKKRSLGRIAPLPMLLESGIYALTLGSFIVFIMRRLLGIEPTLAVGGQDAGTGIILSCGAGLYEELVFRLGACAGGAALRLFGARFPGGTLAVNVLGSAVIGFVMTLYAARGELDSRTRIALTAGLLGGFTTYSSFAYESLTLLEGGQGATFALYLAA